MSKSGVLMLGHDIDQMLMSSAHWENIGYINPNLLAYNNLSKPAPIRWMKQRAYLVDETHKRQDEIIKIEHRNRIMVITLKDICDYTFYVACY